jgi:hypothetical protein
MGRSRPNPPTDSMTSLLIHKPSKRPLLISMTGEVRLG